ncbi:MAG: PKD domain-containing protein [Adhaeribacter sp.]
MSKPLPRFHFLFAVSFLFCFFSSLPAQSQLASHKGRDFWLAYAGQADNANSRMSLYLTAETDATATVRIGGKPVPGSPFALKARETTVVPIDPAAAHVFAAGQVENKGIHVTASEPLVVYAHLHYGARNRSSASLVLPTQALGQDYYSLNYTQPLSGLPAGEKAYSQLTVVAAEDQTQVQITPAAATTANQAARVPFLVTLQAGQVYQVQATADLSGSRVTTLVPGNAICKKIAVFTGSTYVRFGCPTALGAENLYQQAYPVHTWGRSFVANPFATRPGDVLRILASDNDTQVWVDGQPSLIPYQGGFLELTLSAAAHLTTDKPVAVAQYATAQNCDPRNTNQNSPAYPADMDMLVLNPTEQGLQQTIFPAAYASKTATTANASQYLSVVLKSAAAASFTLNGRKPAATFQPVGRSGYSVLTENITAATRADPVFVLAAADNFNATTYWYGTQESYAYSAGTALENLASRLEPLPAPVCAGTAIQLSFRLPEQARQLVWDFGDGSAPVTQSNVNERVSPAHSYQKEGTYLVKLRAEMPAGSSCGPEEVLSRQVVVLPLPQADFEVPAACVHTPILFTEKSSAGSGQLSRYSWDFGDGQKATGAQVSHTYARPGTYAVQLTVATDQGCEAQVSRQVVVPDLPQAQAGADQLALCGVTSTRLQAVPAAGGQGSWSVRSGTGGTFSDPHDARALFHGQAGQHYQLRWTVSGGGCPAASDEVELRFLPAPAVSAGEPADLLRGGSLVLQGSGEGTYSWSPAAGLSDPTAARPIARPSQTTTYELTVTSPQGCPAKASVTVKVVDQLRVPSAFSPNSDHINDTWVIEGLSGYPRATVEVFDRWGSKVYAGGPAQAWDGQFQGKALPMGTYYYIIRQNNGAKPLSGPLSIIK